MNTREFRAALPVVSLRPIFLKLLAIAFALGVGYKALDAAVGDKVSNAVFTKHVLQEDSLKMAILQKLDELSRGQAQTKSFLCQARRTDLGCQP